MKRFLTGAVFFLGCQVEAQRTESLLLDACREAKPTSFKNPSECTIKQLSIGYSLASLEEGYLGVFGESMPGNLTIIGKDTQELTIDATKFALAPDEATAESAAEEVEILHEESEDTLAVFTRGPSTVFYQETRDGTVSSSYFGSAHMNIEAPSHLPLTVIGRDITIQGMEGDISIPDAWGTDITLQDTPGDLNIHTGAGATNIFGDGASISLETWGGPVDIRGNRESLKVSSGADDADIYGSFGTVVVDHYAGDLNATFTEVLADSSISLTNGAGTTTVELGIVREGAQINLENPNGDIEVVVSRNSPIAFFLSGQRIRMEGIESTGNNDIEVGTLGNSETPTRLTVSAWKIRFIVR